MLMKVLMRLKGEFILAISRASSKSNYVFGQRTPNINDIRRTYTARLRALMEVAQQESNEEAIKFIQGCVDTDESAIEEDIKAIKAVKVKK